MGLQVLVGKREVVRIKAASLAVVKMELGDGSEEELEEEEEKGEEEGTVIASRLNNPPYTCRGIGKCC